MKINIQLPNFNYNSLPQQKRMIKYKCSKLKKKKTTINQPAFKAALKNMRDKVLYIWSLDLVFSAHIYETEVGWFESLQVG